jgi:hypothetical protein
VRETLEMNRSYQIENKGKTSSGITKSSGTDSSLYSADSKIRFSLLLIIFVVSLCRFTGIPHQKRSLSCAENESQIILSKNSIIRSKLTASNVLERIEKKCIQKESTETRNQRWKAKTRKSPYAVDLIADYPDIAEPRVNFRKAEAMTIADRREKAHDTSIVRVAHSFLENCGHKLIFV